MNQSFSIRGFNMCESLARHTPEQLRSFIRRMKAFDMNSIILHYDYGFMRHRDLLLTECAACGIEIDLMMFGPRTFFRALDWSADWFARDENGLSFSSEPECETYPCAVNGEAVAAFEEGARRVLRSLPSSIRRVHMRAADGHHSCRCPGCRKLDLTEKFLPFVQAFLRAGAAVRPELKLEHDLYVGRYWMPEDRETYGRLDRLMYDTFYRNPLVPLGEESPDRACVVNAAGVRAPDALSPNTFHDKRLREWCKAFPGRIFVHENAMLQSYHGVFQHNTSVMLRDLKLLGKIGCCGVLYEAFEPGFGSFEEHFRVLSGALKDPESAKTYRRSELEKLLTAGTPMNFFCADPNFPLEKYLPDTFSRRHAAFHRDTYFAPGAVHFRNYATFALENRDRLDFIYIAFNLAKSGMARGVLAFAGLDEMTRDMLAHTKLWDWMEKIPPEHDPIHDAAECIENMIENVIERKEP